MSKNIWVVSDTHYNHANILKFTDSKTGRRIRPEFDTVEQMNECLLDHWNERVKPGDRVYHLGDVFMGSKEEFQKVWPKFNGSKRLIVGNHDDIKFLSSGGFFQKVYMWRMFPEFGLLMSHVPLHRSSLLRGNPEDLNEMTNVHGHIHQHASPEGSYINACVEWHDYYPVNIEDLRIK